MPEKLDVLKEKLAQVKDLTAAAAVLEWDQETYMPEGAAAARAHQIATLHRLAHERLTSDEVGTLLDALAPQVADLDPLSLDASLVRVAREDFDKATKIPSDLVAELAQAVSLGKEAWKAAKATDTFATFAPHLERLVAINVRKAEALGYDDRPYDALLDQYEPGMKTADVARVFTDLRAQLVPLVQTITAQPRPGDAFLRQPFDVQRQWDFGMAVLRDIGYDLQHGRQDVSAHPFTTSFAVTDVRLTTRIDPDYLPSGFFSTLHEAGHGLYEQGVDRALERTLLADGTSLGMHESQSRLWEYLVGHSRAFWQHYYPRLQAHFPDQLGDVSLDAFYRALNRVEPSLIRIEADELTYNLHIMLRFELENDMLEGRVAIDDLPALWNDRMEAYLGVRPPSDARGVLQDIHWSLGTIGYFPTYALGNLMSVQIFEAARRAIPDLDDQIAAGRFEDLLGWLQERLYRHGRKLKAPDLLRRVTGTGLQAGPWLAYVRDKYGRLYDGLA